MTAEPLDRPRVRTVFLGSGAFGVPVLQALVEHPAIDLVAIVTAPARPAGRRQEPVPTPVARAARSMAPADLLTPTRLRDPEAIEAILARSPGLAVLADYGQLVPAPLLGLRHGALNLHPSLLPRHRGASPIPAAILAGDPVTGVTLMRMDPGLDTGPIVAQTRWALEGDETAPELEAALADEAALLLSRSLGPWLAGELGATEQPREGATLTRPLRREDGRLDPWSRSAPELERQVRAYLPWPGSFIETATDRLVVWAARALPTVGPEDHRPGEITAAGLLTRDGTLGPVEVQPAGGRRMPWSAFLLGRPSIVGERVRSPEPRWLPPTSIA